MTGREFAAYILPRYGFRKDAADLVLANCEFTLYNEASTAGGGRIFFERPCRVEFDTAQDEAAVHELAHAWWYLQDGKYIARLLQAFERQAAMVPGNYPLVRGLCRLYRDGDGVWAGMWIPPVNGYAGRWNHDEIFAGLASAVMGNVMLMPRQLRSIYEHCFNLEIVHVPVVMA